MVVTNLDLYCNCVDETVVWHFRLYLSSPGITGPIWFSGLDKLVLGQQFNPRAGSGQAHRKAAGSGSTLDSDWFTGVSVCAL